MYESGHIDPNSAINYGFPGNVSNKNTTKSKNLPDIEIILKSIHWFAGYRILALISIRRFCLYVDELCM